MKIEFLTTDPMFVSKGDISNYWGSKSPTVSFIIDTFLYSKENLFRVEGSKEEKEAFLCLLEELMDIFNLLPPSQDIRQLELENNIWYVNHKYGLIPF